MKKNHLLKLSLTILTVCFAFLLVACGQKEEVTYYQRIDQSNQFDMRLTYYHKGDIVTKQTTENFISYKSLGIDESQEEQKNAAKAKIEELSKQYQKVKGIKEKVSFDKNGIKENIEIDYDKADLEELGSYISSEVQDIYRKNLEKTTEKFKDTMDEYLVETQKNLELANNSNNMNINLDFDFKSAFIGGLAGAATLGGLAFWASTLGNLGAYILVAKGVSVLSALGISIAGGTATATAFVASIGGPITLGIAAALLVGVAIWGLFSDSWKKKIAKKIIEEVKKSVTKYEDAITQYWLDTENGFDIAKDKMEEEWQKYINNLENELYNYDINKLKENLRNAKEVKDFFTNIPL